MAHQPQGKRLPSLMWRCSGSSTQSRFCQGGRWRTCWVWPQDKTATQSPCSSWRKSTIRTARLSGLGSQSRLALV